MVNRLTAEPDESAEPDDSAESDDNAELLCNDYLSEAQFFGQLVVLLQVW